MKEIDMNDIEELVLRQSIIVIGANIPGIFSIFLRSCATDDGFFYRVFMIFSWFGWAWMVNYLLGDVKINIKHTTPKWISKLFLIIFILAIRGVIGSTMNIIYHKNPGIIADKMTQKFNETYSLNPTICINDKSNK